MQKQRGRKPHPPVVKLIDDEIAARQDEARRLTAARQVLTAKPSVRRTYPTETRRSAGQ